MSSPVEIKSETMYSVKNYGSGMTPFYTNLALWVGGLILVSIFKQEVDKDDEVHHFSPTSAYMGRWLLYATVGLVQGCIVCIGDIILLGVQCVHPLLFIIAGMFCSFVYVSLIYAMAITLKHIGKALLCSFYYSADSRFFRNIPNRDDSRIFSGSASITSIYLWN